MTHSIKQHKAFIYARVSSLSQVRDGSGISSQITTCKAYAAENGYEVIGIYEDSISGRLTDRPGILELVSKLKSMKEPVVVIIDDINRLARDVVTHWMLREAIAEAGGILESPKVEFKDTADDKFVETINAALSEHGARKNAEIGKSRSIARIKSGYSITKAPMGYKYKKFPEHGKLLVRDEPMASIIQEGLEGYASGRFQTVVEVKRFFESKPEFPRNKYGEVGQCLVDQILSRRVYAGYIHAKYWGIDYIKGKHEPLISLELFEKNQERRHGKPVAPSYKKTSNDFPLRGFVECNSCGHPMTAAWSKGKYKYFPYYRCNHRGCNLKGKSINADKLHTEFEQLIASLKPSEGLMQAMGLVFAEAWKKKD